MSNKTIAILQSCYIPWKGYFDIINSVDEFILYDEVQYTRRDWRNRNLIKTPSGTQWLTIPVQVKGKYYQRINETAISDSLWADRHWKAILSNYSKAPYFKVYKEFFDKLYQLAKEENILSKINYLFLRAVSDILGIKTKIFWSTDFNLKADDKTGKLIELCQKTEANRYLTGPLAKNYINESLFHEAGIEFGYVDYSNYPEYSQLFGKFEHCVTILDLIFNVGDQASNYMKSF